MYNRQLLYVILISGSSCEKSVTEEIVFIIPFMLLVLNDLFKIHSRFIQ